MEDQILELINNSGADSTQLMYLWLANQLFTKLIDVAIWGSSIFIIYFIFNKLITTFFDNRLMRIRRLIFPSRTGIIDERDMKRMLGQISVWRDDAAQFLELKPKKSVKEVIQQNKNNKPIRPPKRFINENIIHKARE